MCAIDYSIKNNDFPDVNEETTISQLSSLIKSINIDSLGFNQINFEEYLKIHFNRKVIFLNNKVSIVALQGDIFNYIEQFNIACLHIPSSFNSIFTHWSDYKNRSNLLSSIDSDFLNNNNEIPEQKLISVIPSKNYFNYLYLFQNDHLVNVEQQEVQNRLYNFLNQVAENAPLTNSIVFNRYLVGNNYMEMIHPFFNVLSNYFQNNNKTNIKSIYIISKNRAILEN